MKTLISSALLFCILAAALWPIPEVEGEEDVACPWYYVFGCHDKYTVCGTDGVTYPNKCTLCKINGEDNIKIRKWGNC
uniref:Proteinase inhibitor n=1 Tax=Cruziohyla calcarifer TaxID=318249 RepID=A0A1W2KE34_CRUCA|nr:proteinase inhibitor precursor [Cruziohyla calcarifer]